MQAALHKRVPGRATSRPVRTEGEERSLVGHAAFSGMDSWNSLRYCELLLLERQGGGEEGGQRFGFIIDLFDLGSRKEQAK